MDKHEQDFLLLEFETAFEHINRIDDRRMRFVEFLLSLNSLLATGVAAVLLAMRSDERGFQLAPRHAAFVVLAALLGILGTKLILSMVDSERAANIRYRMKVNHIRGLFLKNSTDPGIKRYLKNYKDLGTPTDASPQPSGRGSTLKGVFRLGWTLYVLWLFAAALAVVAAVRA